MRVTCENCSTKFNLDESLVKDSGSKVRCSKCKHVFTVYPPPAEDEPAVSAEDDLDAGVGEAVAATDSLDADDVASEEEEIPEDLDLSDIEKMLETEASADIPAAADEGDVSMEEAVVEDDQESLDLSDLEKILDETDDSDELMEEKGEEDQDLIFDLDEDLDLQGGEEQLSPTTELDLGDLEKMFESEEEAPSLDLESEPELADTGLVLPEVGDEIPVEEELAEGAETELLGFDIDMESEEEELGLEAPTLDIDLEGEAPAEDADALSLELEPEIDAGTDSEETPAEAAEELSLELEPDIEAPAGEMPDEALETLGLEMEPELDAESPAEPAPADSGLEETLLDEALGEKLEMAFEASDEEEAAGDDMSDELTLEADSDEEELAELESDEDVDFPDDAVPDIPDEDEAFVVGDEAEEAAEEEAEEEADVYEEIAAEENPKGGMKKFLIWLLAVLLVIVIALGTLVFLQGRGIIPALPYLDQIQIPFLSGQKGSSATDSGNLKIITSDVDSRFLENDKAGRMFIVTGKVTNEYSDPRSYIQVSGSLYTRGKTLADTATAYCGNIIADLELSQMTPAAVRTRLGNQSGENNTNVNVKSGGELPFMIVFFNLPESMEEFTVSVNSSKAAGN